MSKIKQVSFIVCLTLVVCLACCLAVLPVAMAEPSDGSLTAVRIYTEAIEINPDATGDGSLYQMTVYADANTPFASYDMTLGVPAFMQVSRVWSTVAVDSGVFDYDTNEVENTLLVSANFSAPINGFDDEGVALFTITFSVDAAELEAGTYGVEATYCLITDNAFNAIAVTFDFGDITVNGAPQPAKGDWNGDGEITLTDVMGIQRYIAAVRVGKEVDVTERQLYVADVNGDEEINILDCQYIQMYLVGAIDSLENLAPETNTVYITNSRDWSALKVYAFNSKTGAAAAEWPGEELTFVENNEYGQGVYSYTFSAEYDTLVFNSYDVQTVDVAYSADEQGYYIAEDVDEDGNFLVYPWGYNPYEDEVTASYLKARAEFYQVTGVLVPEWPNLEVAEFPYEEGALSYCFDIVGGDALSSELFDALKEFLDEALADWACEGPSIEGPYVTYHYTDDSGWIGLTWDGENTAVYLNAEMHETQVEPEKTLVSIYGYYDGAALYVGDEIDVADIRVVGVYKAEGKTYEEAISSGYTLGEYNNTAAGTIMVTVTYGKMECHVEVTFREKGEPFVPSEEKRTVYFVNNKGWDFLKIYVYNDALGENECAWPGAELSYVGANEYEEAVYSYTFSVSYDYVIFSNCNYDFGVDMQTVNIELSDNVNAYYIADNQPNGEGKWVVEGFLTDGEFGGEETTIAGSYSDAFDQTLDLYVYHDDVADNTYRAFTLYLSGDEVKQGFFHEMGDGVLVLVNSEAAAEAWTVIVNVDEKTFAWVEGGYMDFDQGEEIYVDNVGWYQVVDSNDEIYVNAYGGFRRDVKDASYGIVTIYVGTVTLDMGGVGHAYLFGNEEKCVDFWYNVDSKLISEEEPVVYTITVQYYVDEELVRTSSVTANTLFSQGAAAEFAAEYFRDVEAYSLVDDYTVAYSDDYTAEDFVTEGLIISIYFTTDQGEAPVLTAVIPELMDTGYGVFSFYQDGHYDAIYQGNLYTDAGNYEIIAIDGVSAYTLEDISGLFVLSDELYDGEIGQLVYFRHGEEIAFTTYEFHYIGYVDRYNVYADGIAEVYSGTDEDCEFWRTVFVSIDLEEGTFVYEDSEYAIGGDNMLYIPVPEEGLIFELPVMYSFGLATAKAYDNYKIYYEADGDVLNYQGWHYDSEYVIVTDNNWWYYKWNRMDIDGQWHGRDIYAISEDWETKIYTVQDSDKTLTVYQSGEEVVVYDGERAYLAEFVYADLLYVKDYYSYNRYLLTIYKVGEDTVIEGGITDETQTIYFSVRDWANVNIYAFNDNGQTIGEWPGVAMTFVENNEYGEAVYSAAISRSFNKIIFSNGSVQTVDIVLGGTINGFYLTEMVDGVWRVDGYTYGAQEEQEEPSVVEMTVNYTGEITLTVGTAINPADVVLLVRYDDDTVKTVTEGFVLDYENTRVGSAVVSVTYGGATASFAVNFVAEEQEWDGRLDVVINIDWFYNDEAVAYAFVWYADEEIPAWPGVAVASDEDGKYVTIDTTKSFAGIIIARVVDGTAYNQTIDIEALPADHVLVITEDMMRSAD